MSSAATPLHTPPAAPEKYLIAFVIQGEDVFKITADNIIHTTGTANGPAFDAIAKLKAAAALLELTNRHKERPDELRQMARELASEGMKLMARASAAIKAAPAEVSRSEAKLEAARAAEVPEARPETKVEEGPPRAAAAADVAPVEVAEPAAEPAAAARGPVPVPAALPTPAERKSEPQPLGHTRISLITQ